MPSFVWDQEKSQANLLKHGVSFALAEEVFADADALSRLDERFDYGEERWTTIGLVRGMVVLVVAHTVREEEDDDVIRIISARRATRRERHAYAKRR